MTDYNTALVIELGNVVTKAALFEVDGKGVPRLIARGEAPTTGPEGGASLALGARQALAEVEEAAGRPLLDASGGGRPLADRTLLVSKAGGGLMAAVAGVVKDISALTAEKAALEGGATVADLFALNDGRMPNQQRLALRQSRLDLLLLAGGVDEGLLQFGRGTQVMAMAKNLSAALPVPRFDRAAPLPVVFAGSAEARAQVAETFSGKAEFRVTDNVRPTLEEEKVEAAAGSVAGLFEERVVSTHPAYQELKQWVERSVPTGHALSALVKAWAALSVPATAPPAQGVRKDPAGVNNRLITDEKEPAAVPPNVMLVDLGGESVDIYSVIDGLFTRTAQDTSSLGLDGDATTTPAAGGPRTLDRSRLGVGPGASQGPGAAVGARLAAAAEAADGHASGKLDIAQVGRWLPFSIEPSHLANSVHNRRLHPAAIPETWRELMVDLAVRREELRQALGRHRRSASLLKGIQRRRHIGEVMGTYLTVGGQTIVDMSHIRTVVVTGGALCGSALDPAAAVLALLEGLQLSGVTALYGDRQLVLAGLGTMLVSGVVSAGQVALDRLALEPMAVTVAPAPGEGGWIWRRGGQAMASVTVRWVGGGEDAKVIPGQLTRVRVPKGVTCTVTVRPTPGWDFGGGTGGTVSVTMEKCPVAGVFLDGRPRPIALPAHPVRCRETIAGWLRGTGVGPTTGWGGEVK